MNQKSGKFLFGSIFDSIFFFVQFLVYNLEIFKNYLLIFSYSDILNWYEHHLIIMRISMLYWYKGVKIIFFIIINEIIKIILMKISINNL